MIKVVNLNAARTGSRAPLSRFSIFYARSFEWSRRARLQRACPHCHDRPGPLTYIALHTLDTGPACESSNRMPNQYVIDERESPSPSHRDTRIPLFFHSSSSASSTHEFAPRHTVEGAVTMCVLLPDINTSFCLFSSIVTIIRHGKKVVYLVFAM